MTFIPKYSNTNTFACPSQWVISLIMKWCVLEPYRRGVVFRNAFLRLAYFVQVLQWFDGSFNLHSTKLTLPLLWWIIALMPSFALMPLHFFPFWPKNNSMSPPFDRLYFIRWHTTFGTIALMRYCIDAPPDNFFFFPFDPPEWVKIGHSASVGFLNQPKDHN